MFVSAQMGTSIAVFVQARMSSRRFPGKVLAPFHGRPIISCVVQAVSSALPDTPVIVVTSTEPSDDPLASYLESIHVSHFRGPLDNVFDRFRKCLAENPCDWILRICADSPILSEQILRAVVEPVVSGKIASDVDLVTTIAPRTFPKGQNAELIKTSTLRDLNAAELTDSDREHVTQHFHRFPNQFRLLNITSGDPSLASLNFAVDTVDDLHRLETLGPEIADRGLASHAIRK